MRRVNRSIAVNWLRARTRSVGGAGSVLAGTVGIVDIILKMFLIFVLNLARLLLNKSMDLSFVLSSPYCLHILGIRDWYPRFFYQELFTFSPQYRKHDI